MSVTCCKMVVFSGYSCFLHQWNWAPRYNWNIVESGIKRHSTHPNPIKTTVYFKKGKKDKCYTVHFYYLEYTIMKRRFKQWLSIIPPIARKSAIFSHLNIKRPRHMMFEIQVLAWKRHKYVVRIKRLMGSFVV
jgi:hypothetical protein